MKSDDPFQMTAIGNQIEDTPLGIPTGKLEQIVPGLGAKVIERNIVQRLCVFGLQESIFPNVNLMLSGRPTSARVALPRTWRIRLAQFGVPISTWPSRIIWVCRLARMWAAGAMRTAKMIGWAWRDAVHSPNKNYSVIFIPNPKMAAGESGPRNWNFLSTFLRSPVLSGRDNEIWSVSSVAPMESRTDTKFSKLGFPRLPDMRAKLAFTGFALRAVLVDLFRMMIGEWWRAILQDERVVHDYVSRMVRVHGNTAESYIFTSANLLIRPLWTFSAEARGARIILAFISTNFVATTGKPGKYIINTGLRSMNWPIYAVWDEAQARFLRQTGHVDAQIINMGAIGYIDDPTIEISLPERTIAVFDVAPIRQARLADMGYPNPYYTKSSLRFVDDLVTAAAHLNAHVALKQKPKADKIIHGPYQTYLRRLSVGGQIIVLPSTVSPHRIIVNAACVVSAPFTSTAYVAESLGVPSAFYDPLSSLVGRTDLGGSVPILNGIDELNSWLKSTLPADPMSEPSTQVMAKRTIESPRR